MSAAPAAQHPPPLHGDSSPASRRRVFRRIYPLRILGMGLGGLLIGSVLHQHDTLTQYGWLAVVSFFSGRTSPICWPATVPTRSAPKFATC